MTNRRAYKTSIPPHALEVAEKQHANAAKKFASFFLDGEKVGYRQWDEDGRLMYECAERGGVRHGNQYCFYPNGQLEEVNPYRNGMMHGTGKQWSEDGRLLVTWKLDHGSGLDLWCCAMTGTLAEEHYWPHEGERGYQRDWNADEKTIWREYSYVLGRGYHGVWREWNTQGKMRRGFPRYHIADRRVTKRQYLKACETDSLLPPYRPEENDPHRPLPAEYLAQRKKRP